MKFRIPRYGNPTQEMHLMIKLLCIYTEIGYGSDSLFKSLPSTSAEIYILWALLSLIFQIHRHRNMARKKGSFRDDDGVSKLEG